MFLENKNDLKFFSSITVEIEFEQFNIHWVLSLSKVKVWTKFRNCQFFGHKTSGVNYKAIKEEK